MNILLTADPIGGVWNYALELCRSLQSSRARVALATLGRELQPEQRAEVARLGNVTLYESSFRLEWMPEPWEDLERAADWLLSLERRLNPDVVHLNHLVHADLPWRAPVLSAGHSCVWSWYAAVRGMPAGQDWALYRERVTASLRAARCVVAPTFTMLSQLERYYGPFQDSRVVTNARNSGLFEPGRKERLILCAGRLWDEAKNVAAVTAVASQLKAPVALAGEIVGPHGTTAALSGVRVLGPLATDALADWYGKAAIYVLPARYEPFGLTALEAALSGCALVLGDIPSLREVWGDAARYVGPDDHRSLAATVNELLEDDASRRLMGARAMARARLFSPDRFARSYLQIYEHLRCDSRCSITL